MNPLISVVVPVYNVERYLDRCIESIVGQTYKNLEIILVDDGSPDNCGTVCDEWAEKDARIKVFHKENGGLSDARNYGVSYSNGDYITFIDSDDYILPNYIEYLFTNLTNTQSDISCCDFEVVYSKNPELSFDQTVNKNETKLLTGREACFNLHDYSVNVYYVIAPCKLYKKNLVKNHPFPKGMLHEDEATTYKIFFESEKICVGTKKLYAYFQNSSGIMHNKTQKNYDDLFYILKTRAEFFEQHGDRELESVAWDYLTSFLIYSHLDSNKRFGTSVLKLALKKSFKQNTSIKTKFKFILYFISPAIYEKLIKIISKE